MQNHEQIIQLEQKNPKTIITQEKGQAERRNILTNDFRLWHNNNV